VSSHGVECKSEAGWPGVHRFWLLTSTSEWALGLPVCLTANSTSVSCGQPQSASYYQITQMSKPMTPLLAFIAFDGRCRIAWLCWTHP
jgi:hypothetical protein